MFVVYHITSTMQARVSETESGAKRSVTCMNRKAGAVEYAYASEVDYNTKVVHKVKKTNLLSGKEYEEDSNTPCYCSPSCESYWSM